MGDARMGKGGDRRVLVGWWWVECSLSRSFLLYSSPSLPLSFMTSQTVGLVLKAESEIGRAREFFTLNTTPSDSLLRISHGSTRRSELDHPLHRSTTLVGPRADEPVRLYTRGREGGCPLEEIRRGKRIRPHASPRGVLPIVNTRNPDEIQQAAAAYTAHLSTHPILSYSASLHSVSSFAEEYASPCLPKSTLSRTDQRNQLSRRDVDVLLKWLGRDCGVLVTDGEVSVAF